MEFSVFNRSYEFLATGFYRLPVSLSGCIKVGPLPQIVHRRNKELMNQVSRMELGNWMMVSLVCGVAMKIFYFLTGWVK